MTDLAYGLAPPLAAVKAGGGTRDSARWRSYYEQSFLLVANPRCTSLPACGARSTRSCWCGITTWASIKLYAAATVDSRCLSHSDQFQDSKGYQEWRAFRHFRVYIEDGNGLLVLRDCSIAYTFIDILFHNVGTRQVGHIRVFSQRSVQINTLVSSLDGLRVVDN